ncbi:MAG: histidine--tRNA ligase [Deltaproteobacteria bacterium]|nr:histidine--tRNA ligase [Deltaproteobacteria bacterium]
MSQLSTQPYKGTRDFYPVDMRVRNWMFSRVRRTLKAYGYEEYDGPMLEPFELYAAKTSEEIVNEQLYWLVDRGERKMAVRPEMTPTLARMVAQKQNELPRPIRWFSIPNLWRYERPQRGRLREHWQLNVDVFGGDALAEDLEICQVIVALMEGFGAVSGFEVRLNHRGVTDYVFRELLKLTDAQIPVIGRLLDAAAKMGMDAFGENLAKEGMSASQIELLKSLLQKDAADRLRKQLGDNPHFAHLARLLQRLDELGIGPLFRYDPSIMRGFMYYTGMVLEVYDLHPDNNRALFGGGRYDNLVGMFGGKPLPGVGFGMGDVTLRNFLEINKLLPNLSAPNGLYVAHLDEPQLLDAQKIALQLRKLFANASIEVPVLTALSPDKPKKIFATAEKLGARTVVFVGGDDVKAGRYPMKDMVTGEQTTGVPGELAIKYMTVAMSAAAGAIHGP